MWIEIENCTECQHHLIIADPDPHDWFCDDDVALVCTLTPNLDINLDAEYLSDRHKNRSVQKNMRPYRVKRETKIPEWCPILSNRIWTK